MTYKTKFMYDFEERITKAEYFFQNTFLKFVKPECWIAGGAITSFILTGKVERDVDLWFKSCEGYDRALDSFLEGHRAPMIGNSDYGTSVLFKGHRVELKKLFYDSAQITVNSFDYSCCAGAVTMEGFVCSDYYIQDLATRNLRLVNNTGAYSSLKRMVKFTQRGFIPNEQTFQDLCLQIGEDY